jgi:hypothetical protein
MGIWEEGREIHKPQSHHRLELLLSSDTGNRLLGSGEAVKAINEVSRHSVAAGPTWNAGACVFCVPTVLCGSPVLRASLSSDGIGSVVRSNFI